MKKQITTILVLAFTGFCILSVFVGKKNDPFKSLSQTNLIDNRFDNFLTSMFSNASHILSLDKEIIVNDEFNKDAINIYAVNFHKNNVRERSILGERYSNFKSLVKGNIIAFYPNIIVIDIHYLSFLIIESHAETFKYFDHFSPHYDYSTLEALMTLTRINRFRSYLTNDSKFTIGEENGTKLDSLASFIVNSDFNSNKIFNFPSIQSVSDSTFFTKEAKSLNDLHNIFFLFISLHELSHLIYDHSTSFPSIISYKVKKLANPKFEEIRADSIAFNALYKYLEINQADIFYNIGFANLIDIIEIYRDIVIAESLPELRGINLTNLLITIEEDTSSGMELSYGNIAGVKKAHKEWFPSLTFSEYQDFKKKAFENGGGKSHTHIFQRSDKILNIIEKIFGAKPVYVFEPYFDIFELFISGDESSLFLRHIDGAIPISAEKIIEFIKPHAIIDTAYNFRNNHTLIFFLYNNLGFIELVLNPENEGSFKYLKIVCTYDYDENGIVTKETLHSAYLLFGLQKLMFKQNDSQKEKLFSSKYMEFYSNNKMHLVEDADFATIKFRHLNNEKYYVAELLPLNRLID
jgi:hypothetical protein